MGSWVHADELTLFHHDDTETNYKNGVQYRHERADDTVAILDAQTNSEVQHIDVLRVEARRRHART